MNVRPELLSMTRPEAEAYLKYVRTAGPRGTPLSAAAVSEAEELLGMLAPEKNLGWSGRALDPEQYAKSGDDPSLLPRRFEDAMLAVAERAKLPTETVEKCFARLGREGWSTPAGTRVAILSRAAQRARALLAKREGDLARESAPERLSKRETLESQLDGYVRSQVRPDETLEKAYTRLLASDGAAIELVLQIRSCV
jgi:hypothetical protein